MSLYTELLTPVKAELPYFVVDTSDPVAVPSVPLQGNGIGNTYFSFGNQNPDTWFRADDNIILVSYGFIMPENFVMATLPATTTMGSNIISLLVYTNGARNRYFKEISGSTGFLSCPAENYEWAINCFMRPSDNNIVDFWKLTGDMDLAGGVAPRVSMQGVPSGLNGTTQYIIPFVRVIHNFPLRTNPA